MGIVSKVLANVGGIHRCCGVYTAAEYVAAMVTTAPQILRTHTLASVDRSMRGMQTYTVQGARITLDSRYFSGAREMYCRGVYFPTSDFALCPGTTVVDLGANAGLFSLLAAKLGCQLIAVEAQSGLIKEIRALAHAQGVADRIETECALVGATKGALSDRGRLESASHFDGVVPRELSMVELLDKHSIETVDFLKVDIEGSEFALFSGRCEWLSRVRRIAMEIHPEFGDPAEIAQLLAERGFSCELRDNLLRHATAIPEGGYLFAKRAS